MVIIDISKREDIFQKNELKKVINVKDILFEDLQKVLIGFTFSELLTKSNLQKLNIDSEDEAIIRHYALQGKAFFDKSITKEVLFDERVSAWKTHAELPKDSASKNLLRIVVDLLYSEKSSEYDDYGSELVLEAIFSSLLRLGSGYCTQFRHYVQENVLNP